MEGTLSYKEDGERRSFSNNSDDENGCDQQDQDSLVDDFVSFPTIPDPDQEHSKTLTKIFSKTLRKVTSNATHLVQNYSSPKSRTASRGSYHDRFPESPVRMPTLTTSAVIQPEADKMSQMTIDNASTMSSRLSRVSSPAIEASSVTPQIRVSGLKSTENISKSPSNSDLMGIPGISNNSRDDILLPNIPNQEPMHIRSSVARTDVPKVKSDNKSLRLSSMRAPQLSHVSMNNSATSSVINVSAVASTDKGETPINTGNSNRKASHSTPTIASNAKGNNNFNVNNNTNNISQKEKQKILQNRISSIFNNLPNDIELSEDSASDLETINNVSMSPSTSDANIASIHIHDNLLAGGKEDKSPIANHSQNVQEYSPTSVAFSNFKNMHDRTNTKKGSSNIPGLLLGNAKSIINNNIAGSVVSSASSIVTSSRKNKKKKKPRKSSENPLKNGGIPKQYWMNDAFVSDCLNCFKPFSAFRRKHHCRFCGQIYCSDCTLFISYSRHKEERKMGKKSEKKHFNDKLRVCKGCYNDVIVYLSDDSTSSSSDSDNDLDSAIFEENETQEDNTPPQHQLSRIRSLSISSRRDSLINEANIKNANRSFINKDYKSILDKPNNSITEYPSNDDADYLMNGRKQSYPANIDPNNMKPYIKQAPQMAIPATRKGEAVEIPIPKSSYTNSILSHSNNIGGDASALSPNNEPLGYNNTSWFKNYTHLKNYNLPSSSESRPNSFNSHMYNSFLGKRKGNRYNKPSTDQSDYHSVKTRNRRTDIFQHNDIDTETSNEEDEGNHEDIESENEDEQVMSLYSSLNHIDSNNSTTTSALSPRQPGSHTLISSNTVVPTLGEFPTMFANEKLFQRNFAKSNSKSSPLISKLFQNSTTSIGSSTINNSNDSHSNNGQSSFPFLDEKPSDNLRSHERAHASLLRMRSRRKSKSVRNVSILTHNNNKLQGLDTSLLQGQSPVSTPTSPRPMSQSSSHMASNLTKGLSIDDTPTFMANSKPNLSASSVPVLSGSSPMQLISPSISKNDPTHGNDKSLSNRTADSSYADVEDTASIRKDILSMNDSHNTDLKPKELIYKGFLDSIMKQCLEDCEIREDQERWCKALKRVLSYTSYIKLTDTIDIRQYVKIKKILGGTIEETNVIDGMFATKNIDSKKMSSKIKNPKIALLMFPLEYLKQKESFISLRIVHSQQSVYITNLVSRLVALEPDIIIVGDSVCGLAEKLLIEANITVISNTKPQVIERISRYTKANIFQSINDLFFKKGSLGTCEMFEVRKYLYQDVVKSFIFFIGGDIESGFTIALRGGEENVLNSVKYTAETLILGVLNSKFEISLLENHDIYILDKNKEPLDADLAIQEIQIIDDERNSNYSGEHNACEVIMDNLEVKQYVKLFSERKLSVSPAVMVKLPTALVNVITSYKKFFDFFKKDQKIQSLDLHKDIDQDWLNELNLDIDITRLPNDKQDLINILKYASGFNLNVLTNEFQSRARIWSNCMSFPSYQLYPVFHKSIHFLHSTVSIKYATPCSGPNTVVIDYYTDNDKCLGLFLDQIFRDSLRTCDECGDSLLNHYKTYVHGNVKLDVIIEKYENVFYEDPQDKNQRLMWSSCKVCDYSSPIRTMNDETYYISVGKFLELCFGAENVVSSYSGCNHDFFKQHIRYFALNDSVIRMEYSEIDTYEVVVPKKQLEYLPDIDIKLKIETFNQIQNKSTNFFQSVSNRLNRVKVDTFDKADDGIQKIEELKLKLDLQIDSIKSKTLEIYNSTSSTVHLPLNPILRELQELGVIWDNEFNEFEKNFLPTENEITKITQFHLKKFLMDKYNSESQNKEAGPSDTSRKSDEMRDENTDGTETDSEVDAGTKIMNKEKNILKDSIQEDRKGFPDTSLNKEKTKEIGKMIPSSLYGQSNVVDKINKMEALLESERKAQHKDAKSSNKKNVSSNSKASQVSIPSGDEIQPAPEYQSTIEEHPVVQEPPPNKVSQIANFFNQMNFDQISMEFRKQREEELQKKLNKFKAIPIVASKPIVEIYDNIEDVVDVNDETDLDKKNLKRLQKKTPSQEPSSGKISPIMKDFTSYKNDEGKVTQNKNRETDKNKDAKNLDIPQPEKNSLLKSLTNFWADRSATLWDPLEYPLDSSEHTFADSDVIVRDDEPSSLVAFCLSSHDYKQKIKLMGENTTEENIEINESNNKKFKNFTKIEKKFKTNYSSGAKLNEFESIMIKNKSNHLKYQYLDGNTNLSCKIFYSEQFDAFRKACGNDETFIQSLSRCVKWNSSGGKSGSNFLKTLDARYILKELSKSELESFVSIAPFYFKYISQSMFHTLTTAVAKIFGFYQIQIKNTITGKTFKMDFLIMENLFYNHNTTRIFDLKGSMRNRHVKQTGEENEVLLDENMIEYIYESPVFVKEHSKKLLRGSLFNDTSFLSAMDVMDYSLIIGIDDSSKKLYIGIIDWLRTFTWDKKVENWVKGNNLIGGGKKGKDPTIVTPKQYRTRFREAMERYILEVPDFWYEGK